jgi:hypothetical protein
LDMSSGPRHCGASSRAPVKHEPMTMCAGRLACHLITIEACTKHSRTILVRATAGRRATAVARTMRILVRATAGRRQKCQKARPINNVCRQKNMPTSGKPIPPILVRATAGRRATAVARTIRVLDRATAWRCQECLKNPPGAGRRSCHPNPLEDPPPRTGDDSGGRT